MMAYFAGDNWAQNINIQSIPGAPRKIGNKFHNPRLVPGSRQQMRIPASRRPLFPSANYVAPEDLTPPQAPKVVRTQARRFTAETHNKHNTPVCRTLEFVEDIDSQDSCIAQSQNTMDGASMNSMPTISKTMSPAASKTMSPAMSKPMSPAMSKTMSVRLPTKRRFQDTEPVTSSKRSVVKSMFSSRDLDSEGEEELSPEPGASDSHNDSLFMMRRLS